MEQPDLETEIKELMWQYVGLVRSAPGLRKALRRFQELTQQVDERAYRVRNLLQAALCVVQGALLREEAAVASGKIIRNLDPRGASRIIHRNDLPEPQVVPRSPKPGSASRKERALREETE